MTLTHPAPPADGLAIVREVLSSFYGDTDLLAATPLADVDPARLCAAEPHRRYTIGLRNLAAGGFLDRFERHGWRYLLLDGERRAVGELELSAGLADGRLRFHSLTMGDIPAGCLAAHVVAERLPRTQGVDYEVRLFESPSLAFGALWLHADDVEEEADLFVPVRPVQLGLDSERAYTAPELAAYLQPAARTTVALHESTIRQVGIDLAAPPEDDSPEVGPEGTQKA